MTGPDHHGEMEEAYAGEGQRQARLQLVRETTIALLRAGALDPRALSEFVILPTSAP